MVRLLLNRWAALAWLILAGFLLREGVADPGTALSVEDRAQRIRTMQSASASLAERVMALQSLAKSSPLPSRVLLETLEVAPARLQQEAALQLLRTPEGTRLLYRAITRGRASARLLERDAIMKGLGRSVGKSEQEVLQGLQASVLPADEETLMLLRQRRVGFESSRGSDKRGQEVFKKNCGGCHRVTVPAGANGPLLVGVGRRGVDRLLEDLLDPHRNVAPDYRRTTVVTTDGQILSGLLRPGKGTKRILVDQQGKELVLESEQIDEAIVSPLSAMPTGLAGHLEAQPFYDLVTYLLTLQGRPAKPVAPQPQ